MSLLVAPVTLLASPLVKAALPRVTVKLVIACALAWAVALPVKLSSAVVADVLVTTAVRPVGTLVTAAPARTAPSLPVKVSLASVMVSFCVMEPSLAAASDTFAAL